MRGRDRPVVAGKRAEGPHPPVRTPGNPVDQSLVSPVSLSIVLPGISATPSAPRRQLKTNDDSRAISCCCPVARTVLGVFSSPTLLASRCLAAR